MSKLVEHLNGLKKVELSGLVELAGINDIKQYLKLLESNEIELNKSVSKYISKVDESIKFWSDANNIRNQINKNLGNATTVKNDFEKVVLSLGLKPADVKEYTLLLSIIKKGFENQKLWDGYLKPKL